MTKKISKVSGPQGPVSKSNMDAKSKKNNPLISFVEGTKSNKSPSIRSAVPAMPKAMKKPAKSLKKTVKKK